MAKPLHLSRLDRREYVICLSTSACFLMRCVRPVILDKQRAFAPFMRACALLSNCHASHPYVNTLMTAVLYIFIFVACVMCFALKTCRSCPHLCIANAIRLVISRSLLPSAVYSEPRYLNTATFSGSSPSQLTVGLFFCAASIVFQLARPSAFLPRKSY